MSTTRSGRTAADGSGGASTSASHHQGGSSLLRSAGVMGLLTAASRVLGFARDSILAAVYGTSATAQAFVVAFRIPNLLRDIAGEGAANSAFVPVFSRTRAAEGEASWVALAQAIWSQLLIGFAAICVLGVLAAPALVMLVAPGFRSDPALMELTVRLTRILFSFIGLIGIATFFMGLLNSVHQFVLPSLGPVLLNVCMIAGLFLWRQDALGLAWGILAGGVGQILIQLPALRRAGIRLRFTFQYHPGVAQIRRLLVPRVIGTGVYQLSVLVDTVFASFPALVGAGGIAALYFANRFLQLPMALFCISMAQAALPTMSQQAAAGDLPAIRRTCALALRSSLLIAIPSSFGLVFLGFPIIQTLLERSAFTAESTVTTVWTLQWYALGLASMCAVKVLANALYAFHDTWTPLRSAGMALVTNALLNILLVWPMKLAGLALATSLSSTFNSLHLYAAVKKRIGPFDDRLGGWMLKVTAASLGMGAVAWGIWTAGQRLLGLGPPWISFVLLAMAIGGGVLSFLGFGILLKIEETRQLAEFLGNRFRILPAETDDFTG
ncbi:MAG: murein biosynthesis integral membrane protein MurJ [Candidatus Omnitrophica bacterium]|nr:murein biosynthesis integral membrane protein MurJ [Candidatus Omnitrophota bacterium]